MSAFLVRSHNAKCTQTAFALPKGTVGFLFNQIMKDKVSDIGETADHEFHRSGRNIERKSVKRTFLFRRH